MAGPVRIAILGDASSAVGALRATEGQAKTLGSRLGSLTKAAVKYGAVGGAAIVAVGVKLAESAVEDQKSAALMATAYRNAAHATDAQIASTEKWISAQGEAYGVADDDLRPALSRLVGATESVTKARKLATLAENVAAGRGKDLSTVTEALAKGYQGSLGGLARLGVATKDQAGKTKTLSQITQELADKYRGAAASAAETAAGKFDRAKLALSETGEAIGYKLLPVATELANFLVDTGIPAIEKGADAAGKKLGPAVQDLTGWVKENKGELKDLGSQLVDTVIPAVEKAGHLVGQAVGFFAGLPDPVKRSAVELGLAAAVLTKFNSAVGGVNLGGLIGNLRSAETRAQGLQQAAKAAAGAAGLALLIQSTQESSRELSALERVGGGVATGFAVGGPVGGALGGFAALAASIGQELATSGHKATNAYKAMAAVDPVDEATRNLANLYKTLDQVTGAYTSSTRASLLNMLQTNGVVDAAAKFGISSRTVVNAALGQKAALGQIAPVVDKYKAQINEISDIQANLYKDRKYSTDAGFLTAAGFKYTEQLTKQKQELQENLATLQKAPGVLKSQTSAVLAASAATADYTGKLKGIPKSARTDILANGLEPTTAGIAELTKKYNLTPKQVKTLIQATGAETSAAAVQKLLDKIAALHDKQVVLTTVQKVVNFVTGGGGGGGGGKQGGATPDAAGRQAATDYLDGLRAGLAGGSSAVTDALSDLSDYVSKTFSKSAAKAVDEKYDDLADKLRKKLDGKKLKTALDRLDTQRDNASDKAQSKATKAARELLRLTKAQRAALTANGAVQDALQSGDYLQYLDKASDLYQKMSAAGVHNLGEARSALEALQTQAKQYADSIRDSVVATGNLVNLAQGTSSVDGLISLLQGKVAESKTYASVIQQLTAAGLNSTAIQQLIDAGVEGGLGTAQAILDGGPAAITQINDLQAQLTTVGTQLGASTAQTMYQAGIDASQGLVDGLAANLSALVAQGDALGLALIKSVRRALRSHSPSLAFKDIGKDSVDGLNEGFDNTYVKRIGQGAASSLVKGFGTPGLDAYVSSSSSSQPQQMALTLTAEQIDQLSRGRAIQADLDAYTRAGGRAAS